MTRRQSARDDSAIEAIADRYRPAIMAYFSRRIADKNEVEDLTQEVFASLIRRAELHSIENIEGYIFRIAANVINLRRRQAGRRPEIYPRSEERRVGKEWRSRGSPDH